jgi:hypothetical protein
VSAVVTGWEVTEWAVAIATFLTALGVIWRQVLKPMKELLHRIEVSLQYVESELKFNGGATQRDAIGRLEDALEELAKEVHKIKQRLDET